MRIDGETGIPCCVFVVVAAAICVARSKPAQAMPNFAQAYGIKCSECHIQIPALNAYGRYVQRTGFAGLNPHVLQRESPVWVDYPVGYSEQSPSAASWDIGSLGVHADGAFGTPNSEWTYHVQQWIWQQSQAGGLDTAWVAYNNSSMAPATSSLGSSRCRLPRNLASGWMLAVFPSTPRQRSPSANTPTS